MQPTDSPKSVATRRRFLATVGLGTGATLLAACMPATPPPVAAPPTSAPAAAATKPAAAAAPAGAPTQAAPAAKPAAKVDQITVALHQSPWMGGFKAMADEYGKRFGTKVTLSAFPFGDLFPKERNAVTNQTNEFDLIALGESWTAFFYAGGYVEPIKNLDPGFKFDDSVIEYSYLTRWNAAKKYFGQEGEILGLPMAGVIQLFFYRGDLYKQAGLSEPKTWDDVEAAAKALHDPNKPMYGFVNRGGKGDTIAWDWMAHFEGRTQGETGFFKNPPDDWTPTFNTPIGLEALDRYIAFAKYAPPNVGDIAQADQINLMAGGKALQTVAAAAARAAMDDPQQSIVPGKIEFAVVPKPANGRNAVMSGPFVISIPKHMPQERKQAAWDFLKWSMTREAQVVMLTGGGIPVRTDAYTSPEAQDPKFRFAKAMADSTPYIRPFFRTTVGAEIADRLGLRLNQALVGQMQPKDALSTAEEEVRGLLKGAGYLA